MKVLRVSYGYIAIALYIAAALILRFLLSESKGYCFSPFRLFNGELVASLLLSYLPYRHGIAQLLCEASLLLATIRHFQLYSREPAKALFFRCLAVYAASLISWALLGLLSTTYLGRIAPSFYFSSLYNDCVGGILPLLFTTLPWLLQADGSILLRAPLSTPTIILNPKASHQSIDWIQLILTALVPSFTLYLLPNLFWPCFFSLLFGTLWILISHPRKSHHHLNAKAHTIGRMLLVLAVISCVCYLGRRYQTLSSTCWKNPDKILSIADGFMDIVIPTVPRPEDAPFLLDIIRSLIDGIGLSPEDQMYGKVKIHIIKLTPAEHKVFDEAREIFGDVEYKKSIVFHEYPTFYFQKMYPTDLPQKLEEDIHPEWAAALWTVLSYSGGRYIQLLDDDFILCPDGWENILNAMCTAKQESTGKCGFYFAAGSAGLVINRDMATKFVEVLLDEVRFAPHQKRKYIHADTVMQRCIEGYLMDCRECRDERSVVVSSHLLFEHIGLLSSRAKEKDQRKSKSRLECHSPNLWNSPRHRVHVVETF